MDLLIPGNMSRTNFELSIQRAQIDDVLKFNALINVLGRVPLFRAIFGSFNYSSVIEYNHLSLLATCGEGEDSATGFASINDSVSGDHSSYEAVLEELKDYLPAVRLTNTMFLNFWAVEERSAKYKGDVGAEIIKKVFSACPDLDYLIWLCPRTVKLSDYQKRTFAQFECSATNVSDKSIFKNARVLVLRRDLYLPRLLVREALVEDNDDLLPIMRKCHPAIMEQKESYFLANLIQSHNEGNKFYVGLKAETVVGMLATSQDVNVNLIKTIFDVDPVSDIILQREPKAEPPIQRVAVLGDFRSMPADYFTDVAKRLKCIFVDASHLSRNGTDVGEGESDVTRRDHQPLDETIAKLAAEFRAAHNDVPPTSCIIKGFPRTEADVKAVLGSNESLDFVIEATSSADVGAALELDTEGDAAFVAHMDAADTLRIMYHSDNEAALLLQHHLLWSKITRQDDISSTLYHELWGVVSRREAELASLRGSHEREEDLLYSNAFAITMFCTETEFEGQASDMLRVAFEDYSDLDYCLCMVPNAAPVLPLLELMTSVKLRPGTSFNQSLYVMRKEAFMAKDALSVMRLTNTLREPLLGFLGPLDSEREELIKVAENALRLNDTSLKDNPQDVAFVVLFDQEVVGFVALSRKGTTTDDINRLRAAYELDGFVDYERHRGKMQTAITQWVLSPVFSRWSRFIFRETMRQNEKTVLYFQGLKGAPPAVEVVEDMIPVCTRRRYQDSKRPVNVTGVDSGPLFIITKNRISLPKRTVNSRIVVVGGTNYAYSALEVMCMSPHLIFSNIIVVTEQVGTAFSVDDYLGGGNRRIGGSEYSGCLSPQDTENPNDAVIHSLGLPFKAALVRGHLTDIDRENKSIVVSDELAVEYDVLVIASPCQDNTVKTFPATKGLHPTLLMDRGIFGLGNPTVDERALKWVFKHCLGVATDGTPVPVSPTRRITGRSHVYEGGGGGAVIYGQGIEVLIAAGALMKRAVPAAMITVVMPEAELAEIGHGMINESIHLALRDSGVAVYMGHVIKDIQMAGNNNGAVTGIKLESCIAPTSDIDDESSVGLHNSSNESKRQYKAGDTGVATAADNQPGVFSLACTALICCGQKQCDSDVFAAINESGLVYDGGVVVDQRFRTVDRHIYAVGSYSRFSRCYKEAIPHYRFNSRELGAFVGRIIIESQLAPDAFVDRDSIIQMGSSNARIRLPPPAPASSLPLFTQSRTIRANLPGKLTLLFSCLPSFGQSRDVQPLITGEPGTDMVSVLKLDYLGVVTELTYVGTSDVEEQNLSCVVGLHESYLGSALHSYEQGIVQHWTEFFRQDWTGTIYHDKLWDLIQDLRSSLLTDKGMLMVLEKVFDIAASTDDDQVVAAARRKIISDRCTNVEDVTKLIAESRSMEFLKRHKQTLTSYFVPLHGSNSIR